MRSQGFVPHTWSASWCACLFECTKTVEVIGIGTDPEYDCGRVSEAGRVVASG